MLHLEWLLPHNAMSKYGTKLCFPVDNYFDDYFADEVFLRIKPEVERTLGEILTS